MLRLLAIEKDRPQQKSGDSPCEKTPRQKLKGQTLASLYSVDAHKLRNLCFSGVSQKETGLSLTGILRTPSTHAQDV